jgi:hypothetical protein
MSGQGSNLTTITGKDSVKALEDTLYRIWGKTGHTVLPLCLTLPEIFFWKHLGGL